MALARRSLASLISQLLHPGSQSSRTHITSATTSPFQSLLSASISIPAISINLPGLISDIWDGILNAAPKKKTSHMKKRHRQLAGKALKDVKAINTCSGCGKPKKSHTLCPYCVAGMYRRFERNGLERETDVRWQRSNNPGARPRKKQIQQLRRRRPSKLEIVKKETTSNSGSKQSHG